MANSRRYQQLEHRVKAIGDLYLPKFKSTGNYKKEDQDNIRAYLLLIHAEVEAYFEEACENKAKTAYNKWKNNRTKSNVLLSLVSFHGQNTNDQDVETRVNKALSTFIYKLRHNHGIKDDNILSMLLPVGLELSEIDATWLITITSFGKSRGEIAHTAARVQQSLDPTTLKKTVQQIMSEIKIIDEKLKKLK